MITLGSLPIGSLTDLVDGGPLGSPVNRPPWLFLRGVLKQLLRPIFRLRGFSVVGPARLPNRRCSRIVVANHAAFIDTVYFILAMPVRFTVCGAHPRLFRNVRLRALMSLANILKVESREQFLDDCTTLLRSGEVLLIYPEMGRCPDGLGELRTWAAEVALAHGAEVQPCYLYGTTRGHRGPVQLRVGQPLDLSRGAGRGSTQTPQELTLAMRRAFEDLAADDFIASGERR